MCVPGFREVPGGRGGIVGGTRKARRGKPDPKQRNQKGPCPPRLQLPGERQERGL